jgi:hypothetical protein
MTLHQLTLHYCWGNFWYRNRFCKWNILHVILTWLCLISFCSHLSQTSVKLTFFYHHWRFSCIHHMLQVMSEDALQKWFRKE